MKPSHLGTLGAAALGLTATVGLAGCSDNPGHADTGAFDTAPGTSTAATDASGSTSSASSGTSAGTGTTASPTDSGTATGSSTGGTGGFKFDVGTDLGPGNTGGGPLKGSCRPSETYGAAGGFPDFDDPSYASFKDRTVAVVTHRAQSPLTNVLTIVDISGTPPPPGVNYDAPRYYQPGWNQAAMGRVFGLTLDSSGNIYVAASTVYGANPSPDKIRRIDGKTGQLTDFATLPNNGPAFGNLNYDCVSETIYVSNHEDGRIYQLDMNGAVVSTYHHGSGDVTMGPANDPGEPDGAFAPLGDRVWAVQSHAGRLYYGVWVEHYKSVDMTRENEVWSVAYTDDEGVPDPATARKELDVPTDSNEPTRSMPVSDLSFAADGWMLIAQRTMLDDNWTSAHQSTTFDYDYDPIAGQWVWQGTNYVVGEIAPYSAAGGVDHDFDPGGYVWMTGDALDFYTPDVVYGLQGTPYGGGDVTNSTIIDLDGEITMQDKSLYGDVELPIPGDVPPVPPPG